MVKMINATTGTDMYVDDQRVNEYLARGHRLACEEKEPPKKVVKKKGTAKK